MASAAPLVDIDRVTGDFISGWPRCEQSIKTILTTRLNVRVMREWWGSEFIDTMDKPMVQQVFARSMFLAIKYVDEYEPEFDVTSVSMTPSYDGSCVCVVDGIYTPTQEIKRVTVTIYSSS